MAPDLSVVIPIKNEAPNISNLYREFTDALEAWGRPYELVLIDDGSTDESFRLLADLQAKDPRVRVIRFRRNFGQTAAFAAGFKFARGRLIATADGDLQNDPRDLPRMVDLIDQGQDIVCGWRKDRKDTFVTRRLPSMMANRLISWSTGVRLHDYGCSLKVFRAEVVKPLKLYGEMHRFLPAIASEIGVSISEVVVNHRARQHGKSKYGLSRTIRVILDLMTVKFLLNYSTRPLQIFGLVGGTMLCLGMGVSALLAYERLFGHQSIANRPLLLFGILLIFTGLQLLTLGLLAEMQARTYHESQDKPTYVIREVRETLATAAGAPERLTSVGRMSRARRQAPGVEPRSVSADVRHSARCGATSLVRYSSAPGRLPTIPSAMKRIESANASGRPTPATPNVQRKAAWPVPSPLTVTGNSMISRITGTVTKYDVSGSPMPSDRPRHQHCRTRRI